MSQLSEFVLPVQDVLIVLPDEGDNPNTGTIVRYSSAMGNLFRGDVPYAMNNHVIFHRESTVEIELDDIEYYLMHKSAIMGALE